MKKKTSKPELTEAKAKVNVEAGVSKFAVPKRDKNYAYKMGLDCGKNGANETNCNFSIFSTPENTKEWERGKRNAKTC